MNNHQSHSVTVMQHQLLSVPRTCTTIPLCERSVSFSWSWTRAGPAPGAPATRDVTALQCVISVALVTSSTWWGRDHAVVGVWSCSCGAGPHHCGGRGHTLLGAGPHSGGGVAMQWKGGGTLWWGMVMQWRGGATQCWGRGHAVAGAGATWVFLTMEKEPHADCCRVDPHLTDMSTKSVRAATWCLYLQLHQEGTGETPVATPPQGGQTVQAAPSLLRWQTLHLDCDVIPEQSHRTNQLPHLSTGSAGLHFVQ